LKRHIAGAAIDPLRARLGVNAAGHSGGSMKNI
jgi:hypothetical protein